MKKFNIFYILLLIVFIGGFLRFYKLDWGQGLYAHPDEYHITSSVLQLSFPSQMNPHFFSYGTVVIYTIYFTKELLISINPQLSTLNLFIIGRFYSALFSTFTIFFIYYISRFFFDKVFSLLPTLLVALTPGLIQQAHFETPESMLIFFIFGSLLFLLHFVKHGKIASLFFSSVFLGLAIGVKVSSIVFLSPLIAAIFILSLRVKRGNLFHPILKFLSLTFASILTIVVTFAITSPFVFLDFTNFKNNLIYESSLAAGNIPVFYTRQFIQTTPIFFQLEKILPYTIGPALIIFGILGTFFIKIKKEYIILMIAFFSIFLPNAFLYAKWTRFISPTFPFFSIFTSFFLLKTLKINKHLGYLFISIVIIATIFWTAAFMTIYQRPDVRITASDWLVYNVPNNANILVEGGNTIDLPLSGNYQRVSLDFYNLENNFIDQQAVINGLLKADYFFVQSRRVFMNHQRARFEFPKTARLYYMLFSGKLGFEKIKEFHSYPMLSFGNISIEFPDEKAEETWSVFDHPVIRVFKKTKSLSKETYAKIFEN